MNELTPISLPSIASYGGRTLQENIDTAQKAVDHIQYTERIWDRSRSQWMLKHLTCSYAHPWLRMRQISAELADRRMAIDAAKHGYMEKITKAQIARNKAESCDDELQRDLYLIKASQHESNAKTIIVKIEGALKEVTTLAQMHDTILEQLGVVDEASFEKAQTDAHIARVFSQAVRDVRGTGRIHAGNQEYMEQIGICVGSAEEDVIGFVNWERTNKPLDTSALHAWLEEMIKKYRGVASQQAAWLGFDEKPDLSLTFTP